MGLDVAYVPQTATKSQALADFVAKWTETQQPPPLVTQENWSIYIIGSFAINGAGVGVVLISPKGDRLLYIIRLHFRATNNVAEYKALVNGLHIATVLGIQWLYIRGDSVLIVNQVMGESNYHDSRMAAYQQEVKRLEEKFDGFELHHILWRDNEAADALARLRSNRESPPPGLFTHDLFKPSIWLEEHTPALASEASPVKAGWSPYQAHRQGKMAQCQHREIVLGHRPGILCPT
jgi:ribonuclease HI